MARTMELFVTQVYREELSRGPSAHLVAELVSACKDIAAGDRAGQIWSRKHDYPGYTSYASLNDLPDRHPAFGDLIPLLDRHVAKYCKDVDFDMVGVQLTLDSIWINVLDPEGHHGAHIHPHSVVSGTLYLSVPKGSSAIKFEDPRLPMMMAAPARKESARDLNRSFVSVDPVVGTLLLWESWLRHEVPVNHAKAERISVSFNYSWGLRYPET